jgi:hypothetical protein
MRLASVAVLLTFLAVGRAFDCTCVAKRVIVSPEWCVQQEVCPCDTEYCKCTKIGKRILVVYGCAHYGGSMMAKYYGAWCAQ